MCFNCESACGLLAYVDKADVRDSSKFEGNPAAPRKPGSQLRQGSGDGEPGVRPRAHPPSAEASGCSAARARWERISWDASARARSRAKMACEPRAAARRDHVHHVGRPGEDRLRQSRRSSAWGVDGHNSHTNVCSAACARRILRSGPGSIVRVPDHAARSGHPYWSSPVTWRPDTTSTRTRNASSKAKDSRGAKLIVLRSAPVEHGVEELTSGWRRGLAAKRRCCSPSPTT